MQTKAKPVDGKGGNDAAIEHGNVRDVVTSLSDPEVFTMLPPLYVVVGKGEVVVEIEAAQPAVAESEAQGGSDVDQGLDCVLDMSGDEQVPGWRQVMMIHRQYTIIVNLYYLKLGKHLFKIGWRPMTKGVNLMTSLSMLLPDSSLSWIRITVWINCCTSSTDN